MSDTLFASSVAQQRYTRRRLVIDTLAEMRECTWRPNPDDLKPDVEYHLIKNCPQCERRIDNLIEKIAEVI